MITECPECGSDQLRTYSNFNEKTDRWEWKKGCNKCTWEAVDPDEEKLHPEYYSRTNLSPAKITKSDNIHK